MRRALGFPEIPAHKPFMIILRDNRPYDEVQSIDRKLEVQY